MFTKALIAAFALIGAQAIKLESSAEIDSTNSSFTATDMGSDDTGVLAQTSDMYLQSIRGSNNRLDEGCRRGRCLSQISDMYLHSVRGSNNRLDDGGDLAQVDSTNSSLIAADMEFDDNLLAQAETEFLWWWFYDNAPYYD